MVSLKINVFLTFADRQGVYGLFDLKLNFVKKTTCLPSKTCGFCGAKI
jgi:hypothetical protein